MEHLSITIGEDQRDIFRKLNEATVPLILNGKIKELNIDIKIEGINAGINDENYEDEEM